MYIEDFMLTPRELDVCRLVVKGTLNKQIALKLNLADRTVHNHVSKILSKLHASRRTDLSYNLMTTNHKGNLCKFKHLICQEGYCNNCNIFTGDVSNDHK